MPIIEWKITDSLVPYKSSVEAMEQRVAAIRTGVARELVWLLEHPEIYTRGTSANEDELLRKPRFPVFETGRGGRYTYHGPGQRVIYVMLDLRRRGSDIRAYVKDLEQWLIDSLADFGLNAERRLGRVGIWIPRDDGCEAKIGAIGVRVRRWVSFHGVSLNVEPNLDHYSDIVPCGVLDHGVTSIADLGLKIKMSDVDFVLRQNFEKNFGATIDTDRKL
ncbi:MAG: Octanoyltransferase [Alphaproteobacteria bacterium MarineAlpha9_Bin5]|jgi:lipoyl(octanoyl) transferase|nr:MAG: Octanoyltransferase [Alphaproteobacteria bacterium MarineAlpha9_Bin5]HHZ66656.1 lipoyl(octanoyl) transferase LipB [Alphaproteobacteria bacterium]HIN93212.1 lipoyl(octanoyl) transferase LipB [Alphaproteobacteria bacterium]